MKRQTAKCEAHAKPILQSLAPNAMLELPDPGMLGTLLQIGAGPQRLWMSLDVSGCLWSCAVLSWMQHVRSARIHLCRRHFHFFHFFHFFPATRNLLPCCYPLPCLFTDRTCGETFPSSKSMVDAWRLKAITLTFPPAQTKLTLR